MNLKTFRELKGISRKELADLTGVSFRSIQDYEQGHKDLSSAKADTLLKMAKVLQCTMEDLISEVDMSTLRPSSMKSPERKEAAGESIASERKEVVADSIASERKEAVADSMVPERKEAAAAPMASDSGKGEALDFNKEMPVAFLKNKDVLPYTLMHKDDRVAELVFEPASGAVITVSQVITETLLPIGTAGSDDYLKSWWYRRAVPVTQGHIMKLLSHIGFMTPQAYLLRNLGLSLTDAYWVKPLDSGLMWKDVSLFSNEFDDVVGAGHFAGLHGEVDFSNIEERFPSGSTKGNVPKSWICMDDRRYLVKGVEKDNTQQIFNEVVGSYIHRKQNKFEFVDYQFYTIDYGHGKRLGVSAEAFTNENLEFISALELINAYKREHKGASDYDLFVAACAEGGLDREEVRAFLDYQILTDFVITNTDRNYENFGVLRDAGTLEFVKLAPIFDSGNSMFYDLDMSHGTLELNNIPVDSFADNEVGLIKLVKDPSILDLDKLLTNDELSQVLASSNRTPGEIRVLLKIYERKREMLFKLRRGDTNWMKGV